MLFDILGISFMSGMGVFLVAFLVNIKIGVVGKNIYKQLMKTTDKRMNLTTESINNIKVLKL